MSSALVVDKSFESRFVRSQSNNNIHKLSLVLVGTLLVAVGAHLTIPLYPVPVTLQTFFVFLLSMTHGWRFASLSVLAYLGLSCFDNSLLAASASIASMGYLFGFLLAALVTGWLAEKGGARNMVSAFITAFIGTVLIYAIGLPVLAWFLGSWHQAIMFGLIPFVAIDFVKIVALAIITPRCWYESKV